MTKDHECSNNVCSHLPGLKRWKQQESVTTVSCLHLCFVSLLRVEAETFPWTCSAGSSRPLLGWSFTDGCDEQRLNSDAGIVHLDTHLKACFNKKLRFWSRKKEQTYCICTHLNKFHRIIQTLTHYQSNAIKTSRRWVVLCLPFAWQIQDQWQTPHHQLSERSRQCLLKPQPKDEATGCQTSIIKSDKWVQMDAQYKAIHINCIIKYF